MILQQLDDDLDVVMVVLDGYDAHDVGSVFGVRIVTILVGQHQAGVRLFHLHTTAGRGYTHHAGS